MAGEMGYASLAGSVRSLASRVEDLERQIAAMDDDIPEWSAKRAEEAGSGRWTGFVKSFDGVQLKDYSEDISDIEEMAPAGIYYEYDPIDQTDRFTDSPADGKLAWQVFDYDPESGYSLSASVSGDIVLPVPDKWEGRQVLQTDKESEDSAMVFADLKITADKEAEETGFVFAKPDDEEDGLSQMKPIGAFVSEGKQVGLLATSATSAAWGVIETDPWPENSKITVVTGVDAQWDVTNGGSTITLRIGIHTSEIDFNAKTITEDPAPFYTEGVITGVNC
jgi:hypothetical protein